MYLHIDHNSGVPISTQIVDQIKYMVISGALKPHEQLPSVRGLATQLKLNPTTVARVYRQLESDGIIFTQQGKGTFIAPRDNVLSQQEKEKRLQGDIRRLVVETGRLDLAYEILLLLIKKEIEALQDGEHRNEGV